MNWSNLSLQDKSAWMQFFIQNGITKLEEMGNMYDKQFGNRMDSRGNLFATGGSANPDYDPEHPYHYHNEDTNEKVVIEPETYEQWKDNPQFATIRSAVEAEQAAHPNPEYEVNPEYTEALQRMYNTNMSPYPYWRMDALPAGWTTTRGIVFDNNGQPYVMSDYLVSGGRQQFEPIGDSVTLPYAAINGVYNRDYYPVRIPERYVEKQPLPIDLQIDNNNVQQYVTPIESNTNESEKYPLGQLLIVKSDADRSGQTVIGITNNETSNEYKEKYDQAKQAYEDLPPEVKQELNNVYFNRITAYGLPWSKMNDNEVFEGFHRGMGDEVYNFLTKYIKGLSLKSVRNILGVPDYSNGEIYITPGRQFRNLYNSREEWLADRKKVREDFQKLRGISWEDFLDIPYGQDMSQYGYYTDEQLKELHERFAKRDPKYDPELPLIILPTTKFRDKDGNLFANGGHLFLTGGESDNIFSKQGVINQYSLPTFMRNPLFQNANNDEKEDIPDWTENTSWMGVADSLADNYTRSMVNKYKAELPEHLLTTDNGIIYNPRTGVMYSHRPNHESAIGVKQHESPINILGKTYFPMYTNFDNNQLADKYGKDFFRKASSFAGNTYLTRPQLDGSMNSGLYSDIWREIMEKKCKDLEDKYKKINGISFGALQRQYWESTPYIDYDKLINEYFGDDADLYNSYSDAYSIPSILGAQLGAEYDKGFTMTPSGLFYANENNENYPTGIMLIPARSKEDVVKAGFEPVGDTWGNVIDLEHGLSLYPIRTPGVTDYSQLYSSEYSEKRTPIVFDAASQVDVGNSWTPYDLSDVYGEERRQLVDKIWMTQKNAKQQAEELGLHPSSQNPDVYYDDEGYVYFNSEMNIPGSYERVEDVGNGLVKYRNAYLPYKGQGWSNESDKRMVDITYTQLDNSGYKFDDQARANIDKYIEGLQWGYDYINSEGYKSRINSDLNKSRFKQIGEAEYPWKFSDDAVIKLGNSLSLERDNGDIKNLYINPFEQNYQIRPEYGTHEWGHLNDLFNYFNSDGTSGKPIPQAWVNILTPNENAVDEHDKALNESYSDLLMLRKQLFDMGIFDSNKAGLRFTLPMLQEYKKKIEELKASGELNSTDLDIIDRFVRLHDDKQTIKALNEVAQNNSDDTTHYAARGGHLFVKGGPEDKVTLGFNVNKTPSFGLTNPYNIDNSLYIASTGMTLPEIVVEDNMPDRLRNMSTAQRNAYTRHSVDRANIQQNVADRTNYEYLRPDNWLSFTPIIGDGIDAARSIVDINNGNVGMGLVGLGMLALPNIVEKPLKIVKNAVKDLNPIRNFRINRATDHSDIFKAIADDYNYRALKSDTPQNITETRHNRANMSAIAKNKIAPFLIDIPIPTLDKSLFPKDFSLGHYLNANAICTPATNTVSVHPLSWIMPPSKFRGLLSREGTHWAHRKLDPGLRLSMWDIESGTPKYYTINKDNSVMQKYLPMFNNYDGLWIVSPEEVAADMMEYKYWLYHKNPSEFSGVSDAFKSNFNDWPLERRAKANNILSKRFAQEPEDMMDFLTTLSSKGYFKDGGPIVTPYGQWQYPGAVTRIPSNNITMKGVNYPVLGISNTGDTKMMMPNADYVFMGDYVDEYPMFGKGGHLFQGNGNSQLQLGFGVNPNTQWRWMGNIERTSGNQTPVIRYTAPEVPGFLPTTSSTVTYNLEDEIIKKQAVAAARKAAEINARNNSGRVVISQDNDPRSYAQRNLDRNAQDIVDASVFQVASPGNVDLNTVYTGITSGLQMGIAPELAHQALVRPIATGLSMAAAAGGNKLIDTFTPYSSWGNMVSEGLLGTDNKGVEFVSEFTNPLAWAGGIYGNGVETRLGELMIRRGDSLQGAVLVKPKNMFKQIFPNATGKATKQYKHPVLRYVLDPRAKDVVYDLGAKYGYSGQVASDGRYDFSSKGDIVDIFFNKGMNNPEFKYVDKTPGVFEYTRGNPTFLETYMQQNYPHKRAYWFGLGESRVDPHVYDTRTTSDFGSTVFPIKTGTSFIDPGGFIKESELPEVNYFTDVWKFNGRDAYNRYGKDLLDKSSIPPSLVKYGTQYFGDFIGAHSTPIITQWWDSRPLKAIDGN